MLALRARFWPSWADSGRGSGGRPLAPLRGPLSPRPMATAPGPALPAPRFWPRPRPLAPLRSAQGWVTAAPKLFKHKTTYGALPSVGRSLPSVTSISGFMLNSPSAGAPGRNPARPFSVPGVCQSYGCAYGFGR